MGLFNTVKDKIKKGKVLVLSEKYSVASNYAKVMNCTIRGDGFLEGDKYIITWSDGHLCELYDPEDYDANYKKWRFEDLPIIPNGFWVKVRNSNKMKKQFKIIKDLLDREDVVSVAIGTDSGREGTLIGWYILMLAENKKPVFRISIDTPAEKDIISGFKNMIPADLVEAAYSSAAARDEIDWIIGYNFSRAYSLISGKTERIGRCKTVVLNILCEREELINKFRSEDYFDIYAIFKTDKFSYSGILEVKDKIKSKKEAEKIKSDIDGISGNVIDIEKETKEVNAPPLFNLDDLVMVLNKKYGYTVEEVYDVAQKLYEDHKLISYPRTDSRYIRSSMIDDLKNIINCNKFGKFTALFYDIKNLDIFIKMNVNDTEVMEHTAIIPVVNENTEEIYKVLGEKEKRAYDEIMFNFIAAFKEPYLYESIKVVTSVKQYDFITHEQIIIQEGWKKVYAYKLDSNENSLKYIKKGDEALVENINLQAKSTKAPERYTDATLIEILNNPSKFIDDNDLKKIIRRTGIGTVATRGRIITDLIDDNYIIRDKKYFIPTIEGQELIKLIKIDKLKRPYFTAEIECRLQDVYEGKLDKDVLIKQIMKFTEDNIKLIKDSIPSEPKEKKKTIGLCPYCESGRIVKAGEKGYGCTALKENGCRFYVSSNILGITLDEDQIYKLITKGETDAFKFKGKDLAFRAKIVLDKVNKKTKFKKCL